MAISYDSTSDWLEYASGPTGACTVAGYWQVATSLKISTFAALASHAPGADLGNSQVVYMLDNTGAIYGYVAGNVDLGFTAAVNDWVFAAITRDGTGDPSTVWRVHAAKQGAASLSSSANMSNAGWNLTGNRIQIATNPYAATGGENLVGTSGPIWVYDSVLTPTELDAQRKQLDPVKTAWLYVPGNLTGTDRAKDQSGNARDFTTNGTLADTTDIVFANAALLSGTVTMSDAISSVSGVPPILRRR